ncbi:AraC family transcriptional regulator [Verrucomicrobiaceae bacterium N1E253]|uniref:AraC family transcriptional regulator n=2 Tax=Oceaniferula marina TaxID=2748318 RepID=A0A851GAX5_9BACT|nr:AraC family transcriptional regulator [Oceaniferula marina]
MVAERLFAEVPDIVFCIKNRDGLYISANAAFAERLGLKSINSILGKSVSDIFPPPLAKTYLAQDHYVFKKGKEINDRLELVYNRDGTLGWYLARKVPLHGKSGDIIGLASISRDLLTPGDADLRFTGLAKVIETIHRNYSEDLKPAELAKLAKLSQTQLERRMRKVFKLTTSQFIRKTRIEAAARMLVNTDKAIIDIALDCGYGDQSAFTRQYKATVGMAPGVYRSVYKNS